MKTISIFLIFAALAVIAFLTKPADEVCTAQVTAHYAGSVVGSVVSATGADAVLYRVEDNVFYKEIYISGGHTLVGVACFGKVFIN